MLIQPLCTAPLQDNPDLLSIAVENVRDTRRGAANPDDEKSLQAFRLYREKLRNLNKSELREEVKLLNRRARPSGKGGRCNISLKLPNLLKLCHSEQKKAISMSGSRQDILERISKEAFHSLCPHVGSMELEGLDRSGPTEESGHVTEKSMSHGKIPISLSDSEDSDAPSDQSESSDDDPVDSNDDDNADEEAVHNQYSRKRKGNIPPSVVDRSSSNDQLDDLEEVLRRVFGFKGYRIGQRWAIERCLARQRSLLVLPTGAGKSLCYMIPSLLLPGSRYDQSFATFNTYCEHF